MATTYNNGAFLYSENGLKFDGLKVNTKELSASLNITSSVDHIASKYHSSEAFLLLSSHATNSVTGVAESTISLSPSISFKKQFRKNKETSISLGAEENKKYNYAHTADVFLSGENTKKINKTPSAEINTEATNTKNISKKKEASMLLSAGIMGGNFRVFGQALHLTSSVSRRTNKDLSAEISLVGEEFTAKTSMFASSVILSSEQNKTVFKGLSASVSASASQKLSRPYTSLVFNADLFLSNTTGQESDKIINISVTPYVEYNKHIEPAAKNSSVALSSSLLKFVSKVNNANLSLVGVENKFIEGETGAELFLSADMSARHIEPDMITALSLSAGCTRIINKVNDATILLVPSIDKYLTRDIFANLALVPSKSKNTIIDRTTEIDTSGDIVFGEGEVNEATINLAASHLITQGHHNNATLVLSSSYIKSVRYARTFNAQITLTSRFIKGKRLTATIFLSKIKRKVKRTKFNENNGNGNNLDDKSDDSYIYS